MQDTVQTVLVVDDEEGIRNLMRMLFRLAGYNVLSCASGAEALDLLRERGGNIQLAITDINLDPGMDGIELAGNLRAIFPSLKVLYISGLEDQERLGAELASGNAYFLMKPFKAKELTGMAREILSAIAATASL
jgi:two-component system, cell cycle sensor histidine kinase and response regulator CckA